jgi:tRNA 2-thiouridine synthesizing protein A
MTRDQVAPDRVLDAPGVACATLTPMVSSVMSELPPGALLEIRTDDPAARLGVPAWCRLTGNPLQDALEGPDPATGLSSDQTIFHITKKEH